jgi:hypothetical protein
VADEAYVVVETSRAGDSVIGVFSTMAAARLILPTGDLDALRRYRVELHIVDEPHDEVVAWRVVMNKDGSEPEVSRVILCSCEDDEAVLESGSYIEDGGDRMQLIVWAKTQGEALDTAEHYRTRLLDSGVWGSRFVHLAGVSAAQESKER